MEFARVSVLCALRLPAELTMSAKAQLNLDEVGRTLDPEFDPNAAIRRNAMKLIRDRVTRMLAPGNIVTSVMSIKDFVERFPNSPAKLVEDPANNDFTVKVDPIDEAKLLSGLQKTANRITLGLILAALILAASRLISIPTSFTILGYPGLAILFFFAAVGGVVALVLDILFYDEKPAKR
jgi:ubiquinone biosynthesis protein